MHVGELISLDRITVSLAVDTRSEALEALARSFARDSDVDREAIHRAFEEREQRGSTSLGVGVAIPHARMPGVSGTRLAVAVCPHGLSFDDEASQEPVRILVALLTEEDDPQVGLDALSSVARCIQDEQVRERMCAARNPREVLEALLATEQAASISVA
jgi:PTS system nitrogen regulatory IIA component